MTGLINLLVHLTLTCHGRPRWHRFLRLTRDPTAIQTRVWREIIDRNRHTAFGRAHGFATIQTPAEYAARVPLQHYEDLRPYIEREARGDAGQLTSEPPILFAQTSGTTAQPKYVPILARTLAAARQDQELFSAAHHAAIPGMFAGRTLAFVSPAIEGRLPSGQPYGSMSGLLYRSMPGLLRRKYVVPAAVFECRDHATKYFLIAAFGLADRLVSCLATANPSTLVKFAEIVRARAEALCAAIETGEIAAGVTVDAALAGVLRRTFRANPTRAQELRAILLAPPEQLFSAVWPKLAAVSCWCEGSCRILLPTVRRLVDERVPILELGYLASEGRGSLTVDPLAGREVPSLHETYFEFIERTDWEAGRTKVRTLAELEIGRAYYVILTTSAGLYRYFINDVVVVDGRFQATPTIKFLEKGSGATNITGEKLYESQVVDAFTAIQAHTMMDGSFFVMVADEQRQRYTLYAEAAPGDATALGELLERELATRNVEFSAKRQSGRLGPTEWKWLRPGTGEAYKQHFLERGQREAQFKFVRLQTRARLSFDLDAHCVAASAS